MGKFDDDIEAVLDKMNKGYGYCRIPYISFQWETGFIVMTEQAFNKLTKKKKDILMSPMFKKK